MHMYPDWVDVLVQSSYEPITNIFVATPLLNRVFSPKKRQRTPSDIPTLLIRPAPGHYPTMPDYRNSLAPSSIQEQLASFHPSHGHSYDPGHIIILFDDRIATTAADHFSRFQSYYTSTLYSLGWPSLFAPTDLPPGQLRLAWYTHEGNPGQRDFPLWKADTVKEMFDYLATEGLRPMLLGWSGENPFPMIGGHDPPPKPSKPKAKTSSSWSGGVSGHSAKGTPADRVMAIIAQEERNEADARKQQVLQSEKRVGGVEGAV